MRAIRSVLAPLAICLAVASLLTAARSRAATTPDPTIFGYWKIPDPETGEVSRIVRLWEDNGKIVGKIVKQYAKPGEKQPLVCSECSGAQKDKPLEGLIFLWNLQPDPENPRKWIDGKVLNPKLGKVFNIELELSEDKQTVKAFGHMKLLVKVGKTFTWQRATVEDTK